ncbi:bifunctional aspartate kinase/homoserine dehydrogenase I [Hymenobacter sp. UV11]|uniref:bifunctional aspartate kinase/homoserine dehydrogenase I n=1 Tax=Hymenobacter sp. UV11 TaxID=1849735 RepID=UPI00105FDF39|nr:bifunctional aspartate kinase/homoserine dehydrogenase I [Hymenobacter sp. UV11]TDN39708.1 bifunctional aspartate kinase/homoserine dehydrogenase I [Hymenobacter sp. UV11]TFZ67173.1 bifunctional aspartate kinase/homoserine dehydrogenase I [Hymenobacter sp. UV11]
MQVLKFGGTSVASAENIGKVIAIVTRALAQGPVVLVVSALGGTTDALINAGRAAASGDESFRQTLRQLEARHLTAAEALLPTPAAQADVQPWLTAQFAELALLADGIFALGELSPRTLDRLMSYGELLSSRIVVAAFEARGMAAAWADSRQLIRTNSRFGMAQVDEAVTGELVADFQKQTTENLWVAPGFIAADAEGHTTTLGRGGSDYTAAILAAALNAEKLEIWTDVSGMLTADPRLVRSARPIARISYEEAMELSHFGAKVLYAPTVQPVRQRGIPMWIKNTFAPQDYGTLVEVAPPPSIGVVRGLSSIGHLALLNLEGSGMVGVPGFSARLFAALARARINVVLITQSSSEHSICVGVNEGDVPTAQGVVKEEFAAEIAAGRLEPLRPETGLAIVALVGDNMRNHPGISGRLFSALGHNGVNIRAIAQGASERNISTVIRADDVRKAINVLHEEFFEATYKQVNLFILGPGNVGGKLLGQLAQQQDYLREKLGLDLRVVAIANSRHCLVSDEGGLDLRTWPTDLDAAPRLTLEEFTQLIISKNLRNSIFVDVTANPAAAGQYAPLLAKSIAVVACNKVAASADYASYRQLKQLAQDFNTKYLFETNVGAALPVIGTLGDLTRSGDVVRRMQAVLSGTLNFVFNNYDGTRPFAEVVAQAQAEGYTEPDPRLDLNGSDVARKILILAREAGQQMEMSDVANESFLPPSCMEGDVPAFYEQLAVHEPHFRALYDAAASQGKRLKFVAQYADGKASVGLQQIAPGHDLYELRGKDNVVLFYTDRYPEQPLVVKGAGAGAEVTASGVFADIIRAARL